MERMTRLRASLDAKMAQLGEGPNLAKVLEPGFADARLYAIYLVETYHYTLHNSLNQAAVVTRARGLDPRYARFCLKHAQEETGHELMAFHDLRQLGAPVTTPADLPPALPETKVLINYLYGVAERDVPVARLGYSYWAERSYGYMRPLLDLISSGLSVPKRAMTFFNEHSDIDVAHAQEVDEAISRFARTDEDWAAIEEVMLTSLTLTCTMLDAVLAEFERLKAGQSTRSAYLSALVKPLPPKAAHENPSAA